MSQDSENMKVDEVQKESEDDAITIIKPNPRRRRASKKKNRRVPASEVVKSEVVKSEVVKEEASITEDFARQIKVEEEKKETIQEDSIHEEISLLQEEEQSEEWLSLAPIPEDSKSEEPPLPSLERN